LYKKCSSSDNQLMLRQGGPKQKYIKSEIRSTKFETNSKFECSNVQNKIKKLKRR
jgi:hypothetical protein